MKRTAILLAVLALVACTKVPAGHVGVKVDLYGADRGVKADVVGPGRYWVGPNTEIYQFPTFTQNYVWTASPTEGKAADESINFQTKDGVTINGDFGVTYMIEPQNVALVFQKYRKGVDEITDIYLRNMARDALNETAGALTLDDLNGDRSGFLLRVNKSFQSRAAASGITAQGLTLIGAFRYPPNIVSAMNAKLEAVQHALRVENEVKQTQWEQQKKIVESEAAVKVAENNAHAAEIMGKALAANPQVLEKLKIEQWDGHYPQIVGSAVPFIQVGPSKETK